MKIPEGSGRFQDSRNIHDPEQCPGSYDFSIQDVFVNNFFMYKIVKVKLDDLAQGLTVITGVGVWLANFFLFCQIIQYDI